MLVIGSKVPYNILMHGWLRLHNALFESLVQHSRRYERAYLAWETVRQARNPFFNLGTGFEGYFVGIYHSPDEMRAKLLEIGHEMLARNCRLYRHQYTFKSKLMKTLNGDASDPMAIESWSALLGAMLGQFRLNVYFNHETYRFQNETYWNVNRLPLINYYEHGQCIEQQYVLAHTANGCVSKPDFSLNMLNASDYDAGLVVSTIGQFGHPLIRAYLGEVNKYCMTSL